MNPLDDENENKERKDPIKEMFDEMQKRMKEMMDNEMTGDPFKEIGKRNQEADITINFTLNPNQREAPKQVNTDAPRGGMLDVIEKDEKVTVLVELMGETKEEDIEVELEENRLTINTPKERHKIPVSHKATEITGTNYKNNILEIEIAKED